MNAHTKTTGSEAQQLAVHKRRQDEAGRFRARAILRQPRAAHDPDGGDAMVPAARAVFRLSGVRRGRRHVGGELVCVLGTQK